MLECLLYVKLRSGIQDQDYGKNLQYFKNNAKSVKHAGIMINLSTPGWNDVQHKFINGEGA